MIVVTGAAGRLGQRVAGLLRARGYRVRASDRVYPEGGPTEDFVQADLRDRDRAEGLLEGAESLVHLAAIPGPRARDPFEIFENNVSTTFNLLMAAAKHGLRRVVASSSAFAVGWAADAAAFVPAYLPLDEDHPLQPFEPYGLSKQVGECIGEMVARSSGTSVVSLRFTNVAPQEVQRQFPWPAPTPEKPLTLVMWAWADPGDVAEAHARGLEADLCGHEAFLLAQPITRFREPTRELIERNFGDRVEVRGALDGNASVISTARAQRLLGWRPEARWDRSTA